MKEKENDPLRASIEVQYVAPEIETIEIEIPQNILLGGTGTAHEMIGEDWVCRNQSICY